MPPSPFPGMNPYLEQPAFWSSFHSRLIVALADALASQLRPKYYVEVETRTYMDTNDGEVLVDIPDVTVSKPTKQDTSPKANLASVTVQLRPQTVTLPMPTEIKERYLEVREIGSEAVITVIELLSPKNKRQGKGREVYEAKRQMILSSASHLVEIDLLRGNSPLPMYGNINLGDYSILISIANRRPQADLYAFTMKEALPTFPLPLKAVDEVVLVSLQEIVQGIYERGSYDLRIDYSQPLPPPKLLAEEQSWVDGLLESYRAS